MRLRDLINTYIFLQARIRHLLSLPADHPLSGPALGSSARASGSGSFNGGGSDSWNEKDSADGRRRGVQGNGKGKGKERERERAGTDDEIWRGFKFNVPGFHDEVFWECELGVIIALSLWIMPIR